MRTRLVGAQLIDGTGAPPRSNVVVEIEHGRIAAVLDPSADTPPSDQSETVEVRGLTLLPGLIDGHVHLLMNPEVSDQAAWDRELEKDDAALILQGCSAAARLLSTGVTTARDLGGRGMLTRALRDSIGAGTVPGPRILASGPVLTTTGGHGHGFGLEADSADDLRKATRTLIRDGVDCLKIMATGGTLTAGTNPLEPQFSQQELAVVASEAHRLNRRVAAHAHATVGIRNAVLAGIDTVEHCTWLGPEGRDYDESLVERMVQLGTFVDFTPAAAYRVAENAQTEWPDLRRRLLRVREIRLPTMAPMWKAGVQFFFGSDAGAPMTYFEDFQLVLELSVFEAGIPSDVAIRAATQTAAQALGIIDETGTIEVGKSADLLLVDGDPLRDIRALRRVKRVYRAGNLVVEDGHVLVPHKILEYVAPATSLAKPT